MAAASSSHFAPIAARVGSSIANFGGSAGAWAPASPAMIESKRQAAESRLMARTLCGAVEVPGSADCTTLVGATGRRIRYGNNDIRNRGETSWGAGSSWR